MTRLSQFVAALNQRHHQVAVTWGEALVRSLEASISHNSLVANTPFVDAADLTWVPKLEQHWPIIRHELDKLLELVESLPNFQDISADQSSITNDNLWKTFFLYGYGFKAEQNCRRCPETTRLVEQIPGMKTAFFSILFPHKHIPEHRGPYKGVLRYHLALKIPPASHPNNPQSACRIRVGNDTRLWQEGKSLLFDDTFPHEAWNPTDDIRVVLFVDVVRPLKFPFSWLNQAMIQLIAISPYVQSAKHQTQAWEARLAQVAPLAATVEAPKFL